jgi:CRP/FNR family transcriptional regulator, cyclic AMP receptor protein
VTFRLLADVPEADVVALLSVARRRTFRRDEVVFHRSDPADAMHLVSKGHFAVRVLTPLGQAALLTVHGPGDAFGDGTTRSATVSALEDGETFSVTRGDFHELARRHVEVKDVLLILLAESVRRSSERVVVAHYLDADDRVRWALLRLVPLYGSDGVTVIPLTQEQIAELAGVTRPTVNRVLRDERKRGTVVLERGRVRIVDLGELERRVPRVGA